MIRYYQPIAGVPFDFDAYGFVPMPGTETASIWLGARVPLFGGSAGYPQPELAVPAVQLAGDKQAAFGGDLYERLSISTPAIALGSVIGLQSRTFTVWNAFTRAQILADVTELNVEGITLTGGPNGGATPYQFAPLEESTYTVTVSPSGPPTIDALYTWDFAPYDLTLSITGSRVTPWSFQPDWSGGILERMEWRTDILQSFDASEQRGALRIGPRKSYEFESFFEGKERRYAESLLWDWGSRTWALPVWNDGQDLGATLAAGSTTIAISTTGRDFVAGSYAIIWQDALNFEVLEVLSVAANLLTLKRPTTDTWSATARLYPARLARIMDQVTVPRWDGKTSGARVSFDVVGPVDYTAASATTYRSRPVLTTRPNWQGGFDVEMTRKLAVIDNITGGVAYDDESGIPATRQRMRFLFATKAEQDTFRKLLYSLAGRTGSVWVPSWTNDLPIAALIAPGATAIDVEWSGYTQHHAMAVGRRDIRIELYDGTVYYRRILTSIEMDENTERLGIDTAIPVLVNVADVAMISFMTLARLDADAVELAHWTGDTAELAAVFRSFKNDQ